MRLVPKFLGTRHRYVVGLLAAITLAASACTDTTPTRLTAPTAVRGKGRMGSFSFAIEFVLTLSRQPWKTVAYKLVRSVGISQLSAY